MSFWWDQLLVLQPVKSRHFWNTCYIKETLWEKPVSTIVMFSCFSLLEWKFPHFFPLKTSADYKEHVLKAEGKNPKHKPLFPPSNRDFIHEKHHFWQQRLNKDLQLLSYPTKKSANLLSRPLENLFNPCVPWVSVKSNSPLNSPKPSKVFDLLHFLYMSPQIKTSWKAPHDLEVPI